MKSWAQAFVITILITSVYSASVAQRRPTLLEMRRATVERREREMRQNQMLIEAMRNNKVSNSRENALRPPALKMSAADKKRLEPSDDLSALHAAFLKTPNTGLIHLLPDVGCNATDQILAVDEKCRTNTIQGGGAFFSFRREKHVYPIYADLELKENNFSVAGWMTQGILVSLGATELEKVELNTEGMETLVNFAPASFVSEANKQAEKFFYGYRKGKYNYARTLPVDETAVYALRLIAYRRDDNGSGGRPLANGTYALHPLDLDKRADIIVVYRVVQKDSDNSLWILWRELMHKKSPVLEMSESNKNQK